MGDVTHIYDTNGTLVARYVYDAWGNHKITIDVIGKDNVITDINSTSKEYAIGINIFDWFGVGLSGTDRINGNLSFKITPVVEFGVEIGLSGIGLNLSLGADNTVDISGNIGWGTIAAVGIAIEVIPAIIKSIGAIAVLALA